MRLLYVLSGFPTNSQTFITNEMLALQALGADIAIASVWSGEPNARVSAADAQLMNRVLYLRLSSLRLWWGALMVLLRQPALLGLIGWLLREHLVSPFALLKLGASLPKGLYLGGWARQHRIDHIHAHFLASATTIALLAAAAAGIPYTATAHAFDIFQHSGRHRHAALRLKCERAAAIIAISDFNRRHLLAQHPGVRARIEVVYNSIDLDLFTRSAERRARGAHILSVGRLVPKKGYEYLIRALAKLRSEGVSAELSIIGDGELEHLLKALVDELNLTAHVHFLGRMPEEDTVAHYQRADVFALASVPLPDGDMDGLPTVLIEALAMELPVVSTALSGIPEIIEDGVTGRCVPPFDVEALAAALRWLLEYPDQARMLAQCGRERVEAQFDRNKNAAKLYDVFQAINHARSNSVRDRDYAHPQ